jgi:hypothetical protein
MRLGSLGLLFATRPVSAKPLAKDQRMTINELRCKGCKTLLGTDDDDGLIIRRGGMQAIVPHAETAAIVCYKCGQLNSVTLAAGRAAALVANK